MAKPIYKRRKRRYSFFSFKIYSNTTLMVFLLAGLGTTLFLLGYQHDLRSHADTASSPCQFQKADQPLNVAFCDTFDQPMGIGNRSGDLNGEVWGVSRLTTNTNPSQGEMNAWAPTQIQKCGTTPIVLPDSDVVVCNGQLIEAVNDGGSTNGIPLTGAGKESDSYGNNLTILAMYPKQPFDIAGRTGTVTFDVTADSQGPHAAWPVFVYTDQPVPAPYTMAAGGGLAPNARNSFGFGLDAYGNTADNQYIGGNCDNNNDTSVGEMFATRNYAVSAIPFTVVGCVKRPNVAGVAADTSTLTGPLNHFEVRISQSHIEVWGTDPGSTTLKELAYADNANLTLTRGLIWIEDVHYNACKFNSQCVHSFAWDNVGFDGPILPRDLATDVLENNQKFSTGVNLGWDIPISPDTVSLHVNNIENVSQAAGAIVTFNWNPYSISVPKIRVNGNTWISTPWPFTAGDAANTTYVQRTIAVPVPLSEILNGTNTIEFQASDGQSSGGLSNVDLVLVGAGGIPTCIDPSNCSGASITSTPISVATATPTYAPTSTPTITNSPTALSTPTPTSSTTGTHTFGFTSKGASLDDGDANNMNGSKFTTGSIGGTLQTISVFVGPINASPNNQYQVALYADNNGKPGQLIVHSAAGNLIANAWNTISVVAPISANTRYWIFYNTNGTSANNIWYSSGGTNQGAWMGDSYGTWPSNLSNYPVNLGNWKFSLYGTYQ